MADEKSKDGTEIKGKPRIFEPQSIGKSISKAPFSRLKQTNLLKDVFSRPILRPSATPVPTAPGVNPFKDLPFPSPGERIKSDDFKKLSQSLNIIHDIYSLSSAMCGQDFGEVKLVLLSQQYEIEKIMTVFGAEIDNLESETLDNRKVLQIMPIELGEKQVAIILCEAVESKRLTPDLKKETYMSSLTKLHSILADVTYPIDKFTIPDLTNSTLFQIKEDVIG